MMQAKLVAGLIGREIVKARGLGWALVGVALACPPERRPSPVQSDASATRDVRAGHLSRAEVIAARKKYHVQVLSFDASQEFGTEMPYADLVRLRIVNRSGVALPHLTVLTKRYDSKGRMVGSSRKPPIAVGDLQPGDTAELDYYPLGHLPGVNRISVEVEDLIEPDVERFFPKLSRPATVAPLDC